MFKRATVSNAITKSAGLSDRYEKFPELQALDARLKHLHDNILQPSPYILTVPSDRPYKRDPRVTDEWRRGTPFDEDEEQLQYVSFLADWDNSLIRVVGGWDNAKGEMMDRSSSQQSNKSEGSAMSGAKKIKYSLADYRKKAAGQPVSGSNKPTEGAHKLNGSATDSQKPRLPSIEDASPKRSREEGEVESARKRRRSSPLRSVSPAPRKRHPSPPLIDLPPDISPTLPPVIEKELARLEKLAKLDGPDREKSRMEVSARKEDTAFQKSKPSERSGNRKPNHEVERENPSKSKLKNDTSRTNGVASKTHRTGEKSSISSLSKLDNHTSSSKPSKIIRLRIPKSIRSNIIRLLKIPPRRPRQSDTASKGVARRIGRSPHRDRSREREKRPRSDDEDDILSAAKRNKKPSGLDLSKPSTPIPPSFRSPAFSHHASIQKVSVTSDPSSKGLAAHRDDHNASTPLAAIRNGTPNPPDSIDRKDGRPASSHTNSRPPRSQQYQELRQIERDSIAIGRASKHSSDRELKNRSDDHERLTPTEEKRRLAFGLECVLAFMLSYTVRDEMNRIAPPEGSTNETWTTLFQYIRQVKRTAAEIHQSQMQGLSLQLEAICRLMAWHHSVERATQADDSPRIESLMKQYQTTQNLFAEGAALLSLDALQHHFPKTWDVKSPVPMARRNTGSASHGGPTVAFESHLDGDFALPITSVTTPLEAVRIGRALLVEWAAAQRLDWKISLGAKKKTGDKEK